MISSRLALPWLLIGLLFSGCASLPSERLRISDLEEAIPAEVLCAIDEGIERAQRKRFARHMAAIYQVAAERPMRPGNEVTLLIDGPATHSAQLEAISKAEAHVHLEVFILSANEIGQQYAAALTERAKAGVEVRVMYDSIGGLTTSPFYIADMKKAGVEVLEFNSVNPLKDPRLWQLNRRSHRKILVVDGAVAFTGGINISDVYTADSQGDTEAGSNSLAAETGKPTEPAGWRDTHIKIQGPAVEDFQRHFISNWNRISILGDIEKPEDYLHPSGKISATAPHSGDALVGLAINQGTDLLRVAGGETETLLYKLAGKEKEERHGIYQNYLAAILEARERIWITQAYFVPNKDFTEALKTAAERGVDVRLLLPGQSDVGLILHASRHSYENLLESGVRIFEYQGPMIHAKTAVIDSVWATVGSSNLDYRSFLHNDEANAIILGREFGGRMETMYLADEERGDEIELETWNERPWTQKFREWSATLLKYWI